MFSYILYFCKTLLLCTVMLYVVLILCFTRRLQIRITLYNSVITGSLTVCAQHFSDLNISYEFRLLNKFEALDITNDCNLFESERRCFLSVFSLCHKGMLVLSSDTKKQQLLNFAKQNKLT